MRVLIAAIVLTPGREGGAPFRALHFRCERAGNIAKPPQIAGQGLCVSRSVVAKRNDELCED